MYLPLYLGNISTTVLIITTLNGRDLHKLHVVFCCGIMQLQLSQLCCCASVTINSLSMHMFYSCFRLLFGFVMLQVFQEHLAPPARFRLVYACTQRPTVSTVQCRKPGDGRKSWSRWKGRMLQLQQQGPAPKPPPTLLSPLPALTQPALRALQKVCATVQLE